MDLRLTLNKRKIKVDVPPNQTLSNLLRSHGCWSVKHGCETGSCGNCTVILDGQAVCACLVLAVQADGKSVETFENVRDAGEFAPLQEILMDFGDIECGYCIPGMMMAMKALVDKIPDPTEEELMDTLAGTVCHCMRSVKPVTAILEAVKKLRGNW
ncbi:MAG: (2Fe-2S)-binding protein [bacterium]